MFLLLELHFQVLNINVRFDGHLNLTNWLYLCFNNDESLRSYGGYYLYMWFKG